MDSYNQLKALVEGMEADVNKFDSGNSSAGGRLRKNLMDIKNLAHSMRGEIQEQRNGTGK